MAFRDSLGKVLGGYDVDAESLATGLTCEDPSLAVQSEKDDADINVIVKRFGITGHLPQGMVPPSFQDFTEVFDFRSAIEAVREAEGKFMQLPADVRSRFRNDPQEFVAFCSELTPDGSALKNLEEMRKLGLAVPAAKEEDKRADSPA